MSALLILPEGQEEYFQGLVESTIVDTNLSDILTYLTKPRRIK
jgi:hypothetical protein